MFAEFGRYIEVAMRFIKGHILSFILLSIAGLSTYAFAGIDIDCENYDALPQDIKDAKVCNYYRIQSTGARPILYVFDGEIRTKEHAKKNEPFYVYAPDMSAVPDTVGVYLCEDPDAEKCSRGDDVNESFTPVVSSPKSGIVKLGLENKYERYNFRLGTATELTATPSVDIIYNFYKPTLRYKVDGKAVKDGWKLPEDIKVLDTITVEVEMIVPVGPKKDSVDKFDKTFYIKVGKDYENLVFLDTNGIAKTMLDDGTFRVDFHDGYAIFLVTATKAVKKEGTPFTMNSFKDSTTKEFLLTDPFPSDLRFDNPDMPSLDNAAIYDTDGDGIGDSIATWYSGATDSMKVKNFFYSWPSDESYKEYSGDVKQKKDIYGYPDVEVKLQSDDAKGAVKAYVCYIGGCDTLKTALADSIGAAIQSATLVKSNGGMDTLIVRFNKDIDPSWTSGRGLKLNGDAIDVKAISKKGNQWAFVVKSGVVSVGDMLKIETICDDAKCPDGILTAADGVPTSKNNQEVPVQNAGRIYVDNDKNGFYDRDGDGRMDSTSLGFETPITEEDLKKMDITFYWLDNDGDSIAIKPNLADLTISEDGTLLGFALDPDKYDIKNMLTGIDKSYSKDGNTRYGYATISNKISVEGKESEEEMEYGMNDYMAPVISSTFLNPESFQKMEPDKFKITFSEAMDQKNVNLSDDCLAFYVDGQWVHLGLSSSEWSEDGLELTLFMEAGEDLATRMNPADSVRFDNFINGLVDKKGNKVSELAPTVMVEGDPRVIMKTNSFADLNKAEELSDRVKPFTIEHVKDAKQASDQSSLGVLMDIGYSTIMQNDSNGQSVPNMEDIGLHWELYVYTNIGNYVGGASGSIACDDKFFDGNCLENPDKLYVRWNMRADNGRKVGAGIYLAKFRVKVYGAKSDFKVERIFRWGISAKRSK